MAQSTRSCGPSGRSASALANASSVSVHALRAWASRPCLRSAMTSMQLDASGRRHPTPRTASSERGDARARGPWSPRRECDRRSSHDRGTDARPPARTSPPSARSSPGPTTSSSSSSGTARTSTTRAWSGGGCSRELLGTFALVLVAAGGGLLHGKGQISLGRGGRRAGPDGHGDHPVHGRGLRRAPEPGRVAGVRAARRLPVEARAGLHHHPAHRRDAGVPVPAGGVRERRSTSARRCRARATRTGRRC